MSDWTQKYQGHWEWREEFTRGGATEKGWVTIQANKGGVYLDMGGLMMPALLALEVSRQLKAASKIALDEYESLSGEEE